MGGGITTMPVLYLMRKYNQFSHQMQNLNIFQPVQNLTKTAINPGGLCWVLFFRHQDIATWPVVDPLFGTIKDDLVFKEGAQFYTLQTSEKGRIFKETLEYSGAGPFLKYEVSGTVCGNNLNHITSVAAMQFNRFGVLIRERNGEQRLIGSMDAGCLFDYDYSSGDIYGSRVRNIKFTYESALPVPIYQGGNIQVDNQIIPIGTGGGTTVVNGTTLQLHARFKVAAGAPMLPGDTVYSNNALVNKNVWVFVDGYYLPQVVDPIKRHCTKGYGYDAINFFGGVMEGETIEIFTY